MTKSRYRIRRASPGDRDGLLALMTAQLAAQHVVIEPEVLARGIDAVLADPSRGLFLAAELDGRLVGAAYLSFVWALEHGGLCAWLEELYLEPAGRGDGRGSLLLEAALREAREAGCAAVDLEVEAHNRRVESLYRRSGFRSLSRRRWVRRLEDA